jgi:hypothetical protein
VLRHSVSSCIRSAWVRVIAVAEEIVLIHSLNHDSLFSDSGYLGNVRSLAGAFNLPA